MAAFLISIRKNSAIRFLGFVWKGSVLFPWGEDLTSTHILGIFCQVSP